MGMLYLLFWGCVLCVCGICVMCVLCLCEVKVYICGLRVAYVGNVYVCGKIYTLSMWYCGVSMVHVWHMCVHAICVVFVRFMYHTNRTHGLI